MPRFVLLNAQPSEVVSGGFLRTRLDGVQAVVALDPEVPLMALVEELYAHALSLEQHGEAEPCSEPKPPQQ